MASILTTPLAPGDVTHRDQAQAVLLSSFDDRKRYSESRILAELNPQPLPAYRQFFIATHNDKVVGVGGVKAADWASDTHLLYLSAVAQEFRGQGIGRVLLASRIGWLRSHFPRGRILVSTHKTRRFRDFGFKPVGKDGKGGKQLMLLEF